MVETVEEKIRNKITPIYNLLSFIQKYVDENGDINEEIDLGELLYGNMNYIETCFKSCNDLIKIGEIVDKHLPNSFNIK